MKNLYCLNPNQIIHTLIISVFFSNLNATEITISFDLFCVYKVGYIFLLCIHGSFYANMISGVKHARIEET